MLFCSIECDDPEKMCNGHVTQYNYRYDDVHDNNWHTDEGIVTDKGTMPVSKLLIQQHWYRHKWWMWNSGIKIHIGPLECSGSMETMTKGTLICI